MSAARSAILLALALLGGCALRAPQPDSAQPPDNPAALQAQARRLQEQGRDAEAVKAYLRILQLAPQHVDAQNGIAVIYALHGHHALAIARLRTLLQQTGETAGTAYLLNNLGYALLLDGQAGAAVATLERAAALAPDDLRTLRNLGRALHEAGAAR